MTLPKFIVSIPVVILATPSYLISRAGAAATDYIGEFYKNNAAEHLEKYNPQKLDDNFWKSDERLPKNEDGSLKTFEQANKSIGYYSLDFAGLFPYTVVDVERYKKYDAIYKAMVAGHVDAFTLKANATSDATVNLTVDTSELHKEAFKTLLQTEYKESAQYEADLKELEEWAALDYLNHKLGTVFSSISYNTSSAFKTVAEAHESLYSNLFNTTAEVRAAEAGTTTPEAARNITESSYSQQYAPFLGHALINPELSVFSTYSISEGSMLAS